MLGYGSTVRLPGELLLSTGANWPGADHQLGTSEHMEGFTVGKAWILVPALSFVAGVAAALLLTGAVPG
ncbi:MAG: hypothetical protein OEV76_08935, partial [Anaerolineae bacterium]|nr:hypothetical protein [Anaerolineae bacterium]